MPRFRPAVKPLEDRCTPTTLVVNSAADNTAADDVLTLREAVYLLRNGGATTEIGHALSAGEQAQVNPSGFGKFGLFDTITFDPSLAGQTIALTQDDPASTLGTGTALAFNSTRTVTIDGASAPGLVISGNDQRRIFEVRGGTLRLSGLTLAHGTASFDLYYLSAAGGAVAVGASNNGMGALVADGVTFRDNSARSATDSAVGGAVHSMNGSLTLTNCTFTGNVAEDASGGRGGAISIYNSVASLTNVTASSNRANSGVGLYAAFTRTDYPTLAVTNSVFGQTDTSSHDVAIANFAATPPAVSGSNNLVRRSVGVPASLVASTADPQLLPLTDNGGPTPTMRPAAGSPLLNAGTNAAVTTATDQRGQSRIAGAAVDIGAVEVQADGFAVGTGPGVPSQVIVYNPDGTQRFAVQPYSATFTGGVFVATGDVNGDGTDDLVTSTGVGGAANVRVFDGHGGGNLVNSFLAYPAAFTGGVNVAVGDINGDGLADIICGVGKGGGPNVRVFSGKDNTLLFSQFVYPEAFTGGVRVTAADVNGDGFADIICGVGSGGGPNVRVIDGRTGSLLNSFYAYPSTFTGGLFLAAGDVNGDGAVDVVTGVESGGGPNVRAFDANTSASVSSFFAFDPNQTGGVRVATADVNGDGYADYVSGSGPGGTGRVRVISGKDAATNLLAPFTPFGSLTVVAGVSVG